uniref:Uncharacterized protein n=1 Tax=Pseudellipsoidion edaphicum TaxID=1431838 RepID=A0A410D2V4_9STRA|nr:hypothetical protein Ycf49 [Pseudellipsoidion edaphicum]QAA12057.1 hypothetical protein Ycf49 [Pseudellipsoidion edaphicum]
MIKLSFQTWYIHSLSVIDWLVFIEICWQYAYQTKSKKIINLTTSLTTFFLSGLCILTWHYFFNSTNLIWLIIFQSLLTLLGNLGLMYSSRSFYDRI